MRYLTLCLILLAAASPQQSSPVVVELFTSEGCSDCPPADDLLNSMAEHPTGNLTVIPMAFHVTYWDSDGWRDRFSDARFTQRQKDYQDALHTQTLYTPQSVIDGNYETVGNNPNNVIALIRRAAAEPKPVTVELSSNGGSVSVAAHAQDSRASGRVLLAITEDGLSTEVNAGENRSRTLHHNAVVRSLEEVGKLKDGAFSRNIRVKVGKDWQPGKLHAVVLVQDRNDRILGAGTAELQR